MESLIDQLTSNPVLLAVVIVLAVLILFSVMKKLVKVLNESDFLGFRYTIYRVFQGICDDLDLS